MEIKQTDVNCISITQPIGKNFEKWYLIQGDQHIDHPECDRELLERHLKEMQKRNGSLISVGDTFDIMQSKGDPRRSKGELSTKFAQNNYVDQVVDDAAQFFEPYAKDIIVMGKGNHEMAALKNLETDVMGRLGQLLGYMTKSPPIIFGYTGFIKFKFYYLDSKGRKGRHQTVTLWFTHGSGGGTGLTRLYRQLASVNADIYISGHNHNSFYTEIDRIQTTIIGSVKKKPVIWAKTPSYKDSYNGVDDWETQKEIFSKPKGGWWLRFYSTGSANINYELIRAT